MLIGNTLFRYRHGEIKEINQIKSNNGVAIKNDSILYVSSSQHGLMQMQMDTGVITELEDQYDGRVFLINGEYIGIVKEYDLVVQSLRDKEDKWKIKIFMKAHTIKQILLKDKCVQIESFSNSIEQYTLMTHEQSGNSYSAVMRPRKYTQDTIMSDNINDVTQMKAHFTKGEEDGNIIKVIYDEVKSRCGHCSTQTSTNTHRDGAEEDRYNFLIIRQDRREVMI